MRAIVLLISFVAVLYCTTDLASMTHADDEAIAKYDDQVAACEKSGHKDCDQITEPELSPFGKAIQFGIEYAVGPYQ